MPEPPLSDIQRSVSHQGSDSRLYGLIQGIDEKLHAIHAKIDAVHANVGALTAELRAHAVATDAKLDQILRVLSSR